MYLRVNTHLIKKHLIYQGSKQLALENWTKINDLSRFIVESDMDPMRPNNLKFNDFIDWMTHSILPYKGILSVTSRAKCTEFCIGRQNPNS